jgi:hypothetical protein
MAGSRNGLSPDADKLTRKPLTIVGLRMPVLLNARVQGANAG